MIRPLHGEPRLSGFTVVEPQTSFLRNLSNAKQVPHSFYTPYLPLPEPGFLVLLANKRRSKRNIREQTLHCYVHQRKLTRRILLFTYLRLFWTVQLWSAKTIQGTPYGRGARGLPLLSLFGRGIIARTLIFPLLLCCSGVLCCVIGPFCYTRPKPSPSRTPT